MATFGLTAGSDALSAGVKEDRQFYQDNFLQPSIDLRAIGLGMGIGNQYNASRDAIASSGRAFNTAEGAYGRDVARSGVAGDATQQASRQRRMSLGRIISEVDAGNRASRGAKQTQRDAQTFGTQMYGDLVTDSNSSLRAIAQAEQDREAQYSGAKSGANAGAAGLVGMVASFI